MSGFSEWLNQRLPIAKVWQDHFTHYYAPKNFNFWYYFGSLSILVLVSQILTGIWLTMYYTPTAAGAFASIEYIMRDVNYGWLLRYVHSTGASAFFIVIYLHMLRGLLYGSYQKPRELIWILGVLLFLLIIVEAFMGYLLPWGQMSYWGAQVITSLFSAIPFVGKSLVIWIRGDYNVSGVTLNRFFALHVIAIPLLMLIIVFLHIIALHQVGSNNPDGIDIKKYKDTQGKPLDGIAFHPYYTVKDLFGAAIFLLIFFGVVFFMPTFNGYFLEAANFAPADPLVTPSHIAPLWYLTPFYAMLRAVPNKLLGVLLMFSAIAILLVLPWLDKSPVRSIRYKGIWSKVALTIMIISFLLLMILGLQPVDPVKTWIARLATIGYFAYFLFMPVYTKLETCLIVPERIPCKSGQK